MEGVTVLNEIVTSASIKMEVGLFICLLLLISSEMCILFHYNESKCFKLDLANITCILIIIGAALATGIFIVNIRNSTGIKTYEVIISEDVSFTEFISKYEIIDQHGEIYVVKERDEGE